MIWTTRPDATTINSYSNDHMGHHLGIEITEIGDDYITGRMPVNEKTRQPYGILHGGASCVLAETLGSLGGAFCVDTQTPITCVRLLTDTSSGLRDRYMSAKPLRFGISRL
jgi:1,4-dihydroxy-2-naphthoyl-CoA hydrolase